VEFLDQVATAFPNVVYLSFMRNPASPPLVCVSEDDVAAAKRYRTYVIYRLPKLQFLDASPVTAAEKAEAAEKGQFLAPRRPKKSVQASAAAGGSTAGSVFGSL
jgi:hypothetical protein